MYLKEEGEKNIRSDDMLNAVNVIRSRRCREKRVEHIEFVLRKRRCGGWLVCVCGSPRANYFEFQKNSNGAQA